MPPLLNPVFLPFLFLFHAFFLFYSVTHAGYRIQCEWTVASRGHLKNLHLRVPFLPSNDPPSMPIAFYPPLPLPLVSRASSKPVLCFKEIPSSPLLAQGSLDQMTSSCKRSHLRFFLPRRDKDNFPCVLRFSVRSADRIFYEFSGTNERFTLFSSTPQRKFQVRVERNRFSWNIPFHWKIDTMVKSNSLCLYKIQNTRYN